ncbi:MAG: TonB-dependent receptor [Paludibacteraceae bacterium]
MKQTKQILFVLLLTLFLEWMGTPPAFAQNKTTVFPKESLQSRLERISKSGGVTISYTAEIVKGIQVSALKLQSAKPEDWLNESLKNTGISYSVIDEKMFALKKPSNSSPNNASRSIFPGRLSGRVTDDKGEPIAGAAVRIAGTSQGAITDADGNYTLQAPAGETDIEVSFLSYQKKKITGINIQPNKTEKLDITLNEDSKQLAEVTVTAQVQRASAAGMLFLQKSTISMTDGISAEQMKQTSDNNIAQVLKRVAGVTVQDNKFVVVRGMAERYNNVQLNGSSLPSTEPNRRNFSFDIIPSALVDNITVAKTFTPDLQGEFTGGMVEISTLAIPKKNFFNLTLGTGMNTNSTGKQFKTNKRFTSDYFLGNPTERNWYNRDWINSDYASYLKTDGTGVAPEYAEKAYAMNANIPNHWGLNSYTAAPLQNYALSMGKSINLGGGNSLGATVAATYRHEETVETIEEAMYRSGPNETQNGHTYKFTTAVGAVANIGWERPGHKITLRNLFNNRFTHDNIERVLFNRYDGTLSLEQYSSPMRNTLWQSRLEGEHKLSGITLTWFTDYNDLTRSLPEDRLIKGTLGTSNATQGAFPAVPTKDGRYIVSSWKIDDSKNIANGHIMNSKLNEIKKNMGGNLEYPFTVGGNVQKLKVGYWGTFRKTSYTQQFIVPTNGLVTNSELNGLSLHEWFDPLNFTNGYLIYDFGSTKGRDGDYYNGRQKIHATYLMGDFSFFHKLHLTGGVRMEAANTEVDTRYLYYDTSGKSHMPDSTVIRTKNDWLPALTLIYNITDKINIRGAISKTLARPDFRELTPYQYYNANDRLKVESSQPLQTTYTHNYDLRLEWYPQAGELLSFSAFYKYFISPVEMLAYNQSNAGNYILMPANLDNASIKGLELNIRKSFGFLAPAGFLKDLYLTANATVLQGEVKYNFDKIVTAAQGLDPKNFAGIDRKRPLQGMSPYAVNAGLDYQAEQLGLALNYGRIGRKIVMAGGKESEDTYEAPRDVVDFQISYRLLGGRMQIKANASDLLNQSVIQYDNFRSTGTDNDLNYNKGEDLLRSKIKKGTSYSLSVSYNF